MKGSTLYKIINILREVIVNTLLTLFCVYAIILIVAPHRLILNPHSSFLQHIIDWLVYDMRLWICGFVLKHFLTGLCELFISPYIIYLMIYHGSFEYMNMQCPLNLTIAKFNCRWSNK